MPPKPPLRAPRPSSLPKKSPSPTSTISQPAARRAIPKHSPNASNSHTGRPPPPPPPPPPLPKFSPTANQLIKAVATATGTIAILIFVRDHFISLDTVNGSSMAPTLSPSAHETGKRDWIFIMHSASAKDSVKRGDIVTFWKPHKPEEISVKRVVAVEGDIVYPHRGYALDASIVTSNDRFALGSDGLGVPDPDAIGGEEVEVGKVVVPKGHIWVEGDNWRKSYDSCDFGPVSLGLVDGRAKWVWRNWFGLMGVGDERKRVKGHWTRVVEGGALGVDVD
ncbi:LexA/Signal peptidase [Periconia macrospinosa]|uniref:Mitochondrial inner membrane protease subunit n=1 Tax=Periconia macrospinosa TaxID=97972 RepID=A0A2V1DV41_9PLEO|nr:LexA/Signal peptidase [Periconia macrospinosa]